MNKTKKEWIKITRVTGRKDFTDKELDEYLESKPTIRSVEEIEWLLWQMCKPVEKE